MEVWTAEIAGKPVGVFQAALEADAEEYVRAESFTSELASLESRGTPVWNGKDKITFRKANAGERSQWEKSYAAAVEEGEIDAGEEDWLQWLIPVDESDDDEEDEDDDKNK